MREYKCTECGKIRSRQTLYKKRVMFLKFDADIAVRSRVIKWICTDCVVNDPDWNTPEYSGPGSRSEAKDRAEALRRDKLNKIFGGSING